MVGFLDGVQGRLAEGWVWKPRHSGERLTVQLFSGGRLLGECIARLYRSDLEAAGIGDGKYSFSFRLPADFLRGKGVDVIAVVKGTRFVLPGSPRQIVRSVPGIAEAMRHIQGEGQRSASRHPTAAPTRARRQRSPQEPDAAAAGRQMATASVCDVVVFSIIDWHSRTQRPQHLCTQLASRGFRIFYLSVAFDELAGPDDARFAVRSQPARGLFEIGLKCSAPTPNIFNGVTDAAQLGELCLALQEMSEVMALTQPVALVQFAGWMPIALALPDTRIVYDCLDYLAGFSNVSPAVLRLESELIDRADVVVTSSQYLHDVVARKRRSPVIRNGVDAEFFSERPKEIATFGSGPVIGYIGAISEWFDVELVRACAAVHPDWHFVLIGSTVGADAEGLAALSNIELLGERPYRELPAYLHAFDVCIIPFKLNALTRATNPVKAYEYLCSGKPVVSTRLPELELIGSPLVHVAKTRREFCRMIESALHESNPVPLARRRRALARKNSWSKRARHYATLLSGSHL